MQARFLADGAPLGPGELALEGVACDTPGTVPDQYRAPIDALRAARGYIAEDEVALSPATPGLAGLQEQFAREHYHDEDEVRFVLEGGGIFDIRSRDDRWIRVEVGPGDLIVVPAGRHHRFMLTDEQRIRCMRLFKDTSGWEPHYRDPS